MTTTRPILFLAVFLLVSGVVAGAGDDPGQVTTKPASRATSPRNATGFRLIVDSIMRGPGLVGCEDNLRTKKPGT